MAFGMQHFIRGTTFDSANAMSFTYVIDQIEVNGQGNKYYETDLFDLQVVALNITLANNQQLNTINAWVDGKTVRWDTSIPLTLMVTATARKGANVGGFGFALYDVDSNGVRTVKLAPDFVPFILSNVIDIEPGGRVVDTGVPVGNAVMIFIRNRFDQGGNLSRSWYRTLYDGTVKMQFDNQQTNQFATRAYVFSKRVPSANEFGFALYRPGEGMVWNNNCLPLNAKPITQNYIESDQPLAVTAGVTGFQYLPQDPSYPQYGWQNYMCSAAGIKNGKWRTSNLEVYMSSMGNVGLPLPKNWVVGTNVQYIDCALYDQFYQQSLYG